MDLADALGDVEGARAELARYPEGARLAFHVVGAQLHRLRLAAEYADRYYHGARKGRANSAATRELAVPSSSVPL